MVLCLLYRFFLLVLVVIFYGNGVMCIMGLGEEGEMSDASTIW